MKITNFEFKVKAKDFNKLEQRLNELNPLFKGEDHQVDTYYNAPTGRLKLREGKIENALIYYERINTPGAKQSNIILYKHQPEQSLKDILGKLFGIKVIVNKKRRIYFIDNVKFHFDIVRELGTFMEVEAIDESGGIGVQKLQEQCDKYFSFFGLDHSDYINASYSDLLLEKGKIT
ncbi:MAG: class IV adenylate cyclase [Ginsengibacter sp.]